MAVNVRYQYHYVPLDLTDNVFTAYMSAWMDARIPLVREARKRELAAEDTTELYKILAQLNRDEVTLVGRELELAKVANQGASSESRGVMGILQEGEKQKGAVAVEQERTFRAFGEIDRNALVRWGESKALTAQDSDGILTALEGVANETANAIAAAQTPEEKAVAYQRGMTLAASAIQGMLTGQNPRHDQAIKDAAVEFMQASTGTSRLGPEQRPDLFKDAEHKGFWTAEGIQSQPSATAPGESLSILEQAGVGPNVARGGYRPAPVPRAGPATATPAPAGATSSSAVPMPAPAVDNTAVPMPSPAVNNTAVPMPDARPAVKASPPPATATKEQQRAWVKDQSGGALDVDDAGNVYAPTDPQVPRVAYRDVVASWTNAAGVRVLDPTDVATRGTPRGDQALADTRAEKDRVAAAIKAREAARTARVTREGGRVTHDLVDPMVHPVWQSRKDFIKGKSDAELEEMQQALLALWDQSEPGKRAKAAGAKQQDREMDAWQPHRDEQNAVKGSIPGMAAVEATSESPAVARANQEADVASLKQRLDRGEISPQQYEAEVQRVAAGHRATGTTDLAQEDRAQSAMQTSLTAEEMRQVTLDPKLQQQATSVIVAAKRDPDRIRKIAASTSTASPEGAALRKALDGWLAEYEIDARLAAEKARADEASEFTLRDEAGTRSPGAGRAKAEEASKAARTQAADEMVELDAALSGVRGEGTWASRTVQDAKKGAADEERAALEAEQEAVVKAGEKAQVAGAIEPEEKGDITIDDFGTPGMKSKPEPTEVPADKAESMDFTGGAASEPGAPAGEPEDEWGKIEKRARAKGATDEQVTQLKERWTARKAEQAGKDLDAEGEAARADHYKKVKEGTYGEPAP